jgi:hypothetical protein
MHKFLETFDISLYHRIHPQPSTDESCFTT